MPDDLYDAPALYDLLFADQGREVIWYRAIAHEAGGDVLEAACGTGRLTLPLAGDGCRVRAIDLAEPMLARLRARLEQTPDHRVEVVQGDFRHLPPGDHDIAILPFNALHHCADEGELRATIAGLARSVRDGGTVALDAYLHDPTLTERGPGRHEVHTREIEGQTVVCWEESSWEDPYHQVVYGFEWPSGAERRLRIRFTMFDLAVLRSALSDAGLHVVHESSGFDDTPLAPDSTKWVCIAERR